MGRQKQRQRERRKQIQQQRQQEGGQPPLTSASPPRGPTPPVRSGMPRGPIIAGVVIVILVLLFVAYQVLHSNKSTHNGAGSIATPRAQSVRPIDGVGCLGSEQLAYHKHQHVMLYIDGKAATIPALIGIPTGTKNGQLYSKCFYWIHVHDTSGIIHVESPTTRIYPFGDFLDIWSATSKTAVPPSAAEIGAIKAAKPGQITAFYNGKQWRGSYRSMPLKPHAVITLEVGKPIIPPKPYTNWGSL